MSGGIKLSKVALALFDRMVGRRLVLIRETSETSVAIRQGGYVYFTHPDCRSVRADIARQLIALGILISQKDDLFTEADGGGQSYVVSDRLPQIMRPKPRKRRKALI